MRGASSAARQGAIDTLPLFAAPPPQPACSTSATPVHTPGSSDQPPADVLRIIDVLRDRRGRTCAITAPAIARSAGLYPDSPPATAGTAVRRLIEQHLDLFPWPIVADSAGYYRPADAEDLTHYCAQLDARMAGIARRYAVTRQLAQRAGYTYHGHGRWSGAPAPHQDTRNVRSDTVQ